MPLYLDSDAEWLHGCMMLSWLLLVKKLLFLLRHGAERGRTI
jgi:hypothetical protein